MKADINHVLRIYLGADKDEGYEPLYIEERMKRAFPDSYSEIMELIAPYLDEDQLPDWSNKDLDLIEEANRFAATLRQKYPELDDIVIRALSNRWHFGWSR